MRMGFAYRRSLWLCCLLSTALIAAATLLLPWSYALADISYSGCGGAVAAVENGAYEAQVAELVNQRRAEQGLPPMKLVSALTDAARYHAADMAADDYFTHNSQDRVNGELVEVCTWAARIKSFYPAYWSLGENIAWGYSSPERVMQGWMESPGHRSNILGDYVEIGVGYINNRWVQDFGTPRNGVALIINREAVQAFLPDVALYIHGSGQEMRLRNDEQPWSEWQPFKNEMNWTLQNVVGERRVDIEVRSGNSVVSSSDTIVLANATAATPTPFAPTLTPTPFAPTPTSTPIVLPPNMDETVYLPFVAK